MIVNLNVMTKVQLTAEGKQLWLAQIDQLPEEVKTTRPDIVETIKQRVDDNNILEIELWALMSIFGPYITPNSIPFTSTTIELNKNPNFIHT